MNTFSENTYKNDLLTYSRIKSDVILIGNSKLGGDNPIRIQTMTNTDTNDIEASLNQCIKAIEKGAEYIRLTTQTSKEVNSLAQIKNVLRKYGYLTPLIADIHFSAKVAEEAAKIVEKIRINPGNYIDKKNGKTEYTDEEYQAELNKIHSKLKTLLTICKEHNTAIRIGINHGSLSERIMSRYGDTPQGMVQSAMEFLKILKEEGFTNVVISMKASNTLVMVQAYRMLVKKMNIEGMSYPLHLGVTEAGEGEDGRIKSAVGIGALLNDGIGDTIRVSLTEPPENEIPVAKLIAEYSINKKNHQPILGSRNLYFNPFEYSRRYTKTVKNAGGANPPIVIGCKKDEYTELSDAFGNAPDYFMIDDVALIDESNEYIIKFNNWHVAKEKHNVYPLFESNEFIKSQNFHKNLNFVNIINQEYTDGFYKKVLENNGVLILNSENINSYADQRAFINQLIAKNIQIPVIIKKNYTEDYLEHLQIKSACDIGPLFIDGLADGIFIDNLGQIEIRGIVSTSFSILQASRVRISKTDYISCPGCGRTLFNLEDTLKKIKDKTKNLKGLKIGVMGCIVNGPGEMADADYGYVGAGPKRVTLYKNKEIVKKNIPEENAVDELIQLIKDNGDWKE